VRAATGADVRLKWPNDLVVDTPAGTRKLSGILTEIEGGAVVVGIGINVNWPPAAELGELAAIAVACNHLTGAPVDRDLLLADLLARLDRWYSLLPAEAGALRGRYRELSATLGRRVRVETPDGVVEGDAVDIDDEGRLLVVDECPDRPRALAVGDVIHVRGAQR
jgi:BirA family biotin operon repressor/biotin-[acetyl-CoA-carboxylase] ligase